MTNPAIVHGYQCAVCGAIKRESNHWWMVSLTHTYEPTVGIEWYLKNGLSIQHWEPRGISSAVAACGHNCCQKLVERFLITRSLDAPRGAAGDPANSLTASGAHTFREQPGAEIRATTKKE